MKVLHYKSNFLNYSETFIKRLIDHQDVFLPVAMCYKKKSLAPDCPIYEAPKSGLKKLTNTICFHLNWRLPFYNSVIDETQPDIIHAHFGFDGYRMIKPSRRAGIPLVVSFYGSDVSRLASEFDWKRRYRKLASHADAFAAASNLMKEQLIELGFPPQKIRVIRFGLDLEEFPFCANYSPDLPVMMVGRMVEKKGFIYALKAIKFLHDEGINVPLDLYGDGPLREELEKQAKKSKINSLITFHGRQPIEKIKLQNTRHSALLVPSITASDDDTEGIPNTLLEGMASGIPVIATKHSAIPEVINHKKNGFLVEEKNPKAIAEMIKMIKNQPINLEKIRRNARTHIEKNYEINRMAAQVEALYEDVLNGRI